MPRPGPCLLLCTPALREDVAIKTMVYHLQAQQHPTKVLVRPITYFQYIFHMDTKDISATGRDSSESVARGASATRPASINQDWLH